MHALAVVEVGVPMLGGHTAELPHKWIDVDASGFLSIVQDGNDLRLAFGASDVHAL